MLFYFTGVEFKALFLVLAITAAGSVTTTPTTTPTSVSTGTCDFRTINYITDALPKQCLKSTWTSSASIAVVTSTTLSGDASSLQAAVTSIGNASSTTSVGVAQNVTIDNIAPFPVASTASDIIASVTNTSASAVDTLRAEPDQEDIEDTSFLSFDEWRKKNEAKIEQENANNAKRMKDRRRDAEGIQNHLDSLVDEGEIDLNFDAFKTDKRETKQRLHSQDGDNSKSESTQGQDDSARKKDQARGKDAGKTCKERANYASFDAGATVLKTHKGAKNSKAILIEHKDSYMLSECKIKNKFVIVELNEDVWIDTVVLANYEFFSSMIRTFRVSISDRYPVKMEKWKDIGTYEARNSRDIQAFFIPNPQIWGRYIRIEFLTHYGNEYYCPLSLIRVHGSRMLENLKEGEANNDDDDDGDELQVEQSRDADSAMAPATEDERLQQELKQAQEAIENLVKEAQEITAALSTQSIDVEKLEDVNASLESAPEDQLTTPWAPDFDFSAWMNVSRGIDMCSRKDAPSQIKVEQVITTKQIVDGTATTSTNASPNSDGKNIPRDASSVTSSTSDQSSCTRSAAGSTSTTTATSSVSYSSSVVSTQTLSSSIVANIEAMSKSLNSTSLSRGKTSSTSNSPPAAPTQQESFFKAVSRRLQLLEANSTLSLKYIEEQSKSLREAFARVEKRQLNKTTSFLNTLNSTVLTELKEIRQQYDEIWQSTIISLESQKAESKKELLAITSRLNILADEIVFQKRMSIAQSILLLLCLGLVIFSRVSSSTSHLSKRSQYLSDYQLESPILSSHGSPEYGAQVEVLPRRPNGHARLYSSESLQSDNDDDDVIYEEGDEDVQDEEEYDEIDMDGKTPRSLLTPTSLRSRSPSLDASPPSRERTSTPVIFDRMPQLQRAASSSYSLHLNHNKHLQNGQAFMTGRSPLKRGSSDSVSITRQRSNSDLGDGTHSSHFSTTNTHRLSPLSNTLQNKVIVRHIFHRRDSEEKALPHVRTESDISGALQQTDHEAGGSTPLGETQQQPQIRVPHTVANGSSPNMDVMSIPSYNAPRHSSSPNGNRVRPRRDSRESFSIARKPLPALPADKEGEEDSDS